MRKVLISLAIAAPLALVAMPAQAQELTASGAIFNGSYSQAETALTKELRIHPNRPELMLNLAAVYATTGRPDAARALYEKVLVIEDVDMNLAGDRTAGSHAIARTGLNRLPATQVTSR
jgi:Flp pilus assembly protein TadD